MSCPDGAAAVLRVALLGPPRAWCHGHEVDLGQSRQRALFAVLAVRANHLVSRSEIVEAIWGPDPPESARSAVYTYVAGLRRVLEPGRGRRAPGQVLVSAGAGYVLRLEPGQLDVDVFVQHLAAARGLKEAGDLRRAAAELEAAATLCRGVPLAGICGPFAEVQRRRLAELSVTAAEDRAEVLLALGAQEEVAAELAGMVLQHPLRERMRGLLMLALYRCDRQAEALEVFRDTRDLLAEELGIDPSPALRQLHQQILTREPGLHLAAPVAADIPGDTGTASPGAEHQAPAQLPRDLPGFTGRVAVLNQLHGLIAAAGASPMEANMPVVVISGTAGIGKSTLAVHFAHQVARHFPDGQLYVNLRGFDASGSPVTPAAAIRGFLEAFSVKGEAIPADQDGQAALYRSLISGKRVLIVLDNARDAAQVRLLLPASPGCLVLVTSRSQLTGLIVTEAARLLTLGVLTPDEALGLLAGRLGPDRIAAEPQAASELTRLCALLPLALAVAAACAAVRPHLPLAAVAAEIRGASDRLDILHTGEAATSVRVVFSWSYQQLSDPAARMFRLLGLHPGPDISVPAAASTAGIPPSHARRALTELAHSQILTEHAPGRFAFHDLLRAYAAELARATDSQASRHAATHRMLDYYLHSACLASRRLTPHRRPLTLEPPQPGVQPADLGTAEQALAWFEAERAALLAVTSLAARSGFDLHAWQLPWALGEFLDFRGDWHEWVAALRTALDAATALGDLLGQARTCHKLGSAYTRLGGHHEAVRHLSDALCLYQKLDDPVGQAHVHNALGISLEQQCCFDGALRHARHALDLHRDAGYLPGQANALNSVGWLHAQLGRYEQALTCCQHSLDLHRGLGNQLGAAGAWDSLGYIHHHLGDHGQALTCYQHALGLYRQLGDRHRQATTLTRLGDTQHAGQGHPAARDAWQQALDILDDIGHPDAQLVRARLKASH